MATVNLALCGSCAFRNCCLALFTLRHSQLLGYGFIVGDEEIIK